MPVRGVRGAITAEVDTAEEVKSATRELLQEMLQANGIEQFDDIASAVFTTTLDLTSAFPAEAARVLGMSQVPLLCASEIAVPGSMQRCIRVLLHLNTDKPQSEIVHIYLREAKRLRPDMESAQ
ncbi:MAG: chorismate mutase [Planctomycetaceae bacterium]|nr:chorismate mutase [Planctomycetaceae bacterium]